jgi:hypothetical protein
MGGEYITRGIRNVSKGLIGNHERKRQLGRPRRRWEDNIKGMVFNGVDWIHLARDRHRWALAKRVMNLQVACITYGEFLG